MQGLELFCLGIHGGAGAGVGLKMYPPKDKYGNKTFF